jgi:hypothetical protein
MWPPGKDPRGRTLIGKANLVLAAMNRYTQAHRTNPNSLQDLTPEFISELPTSPELEYNATKGRLQFTYSPTLASGRCICQATVGTVTFSCGVCYL